MIILQGEILMKRLLVSILVSIALFISSGVVVHSNLVGIAYADDGGGGE